MTDLRKAAEMALEALVNFGQGNSEPAKALRQALAQPEQEPVAWMHNFIEGNVITHKPVDIGRHPDRWTALYKDSTPCKTCQVLAMTVMTDQAYHEKVIPKRKWVGLTDEEIGWLWHNSPPNSHEYARAIESKLKEKNCE